jgi:DNA transformation protein and related proteins
VSDSFADFCCELLATQGVCAAKRMFGGWSISTDGMTFGVIADLGSGERLWLKADETSRGKFEAAGCERFVFQAKDKAMSMGYYSAPEEAMDNADAMRAWARLAFECALRARAAKPVRKLKPTKEAETKAETKAEKKTTKPRAVKQTTGKP